jgi:endo-1,4-beta-D-glucanase Y
MKKQETMRIAVYCRVAEAQLTDQSSEKEQIKRLQQFLKEQEVQPCRRYRLLNR